MGVANSVQRYLDNLQVSYDLVNHPRRTSSQEVAHAAHVPGDKLAKSVLLRDEFGYLLAVLPTSHRLDINSLRRWLGRPVFMASEIDVALAFNDCDVGAVPPVGPAYGMPVILDQQLLRQGDVYFEAGDHCSLVHMEADDFDYVMRSARRSVISYHM